MKTVVEYGLIGADDYASLNHAIADNDLQAYADIAVPACEKSILLFSHLFMRQDICPPVAERWAEIEAHRRILIRLPRQHGKTSLFTNALAAHRICYGTVPGSRHQDARILALFETRDRAIDRMRPLRQLFEAGGPGGLIGAVFRGAQGTHVAGMSIPEMAKAYGAWTDLTIDIPHPTGHFKPDPTVRALAPGMATVGFAPSDILMDDLVGTRTADSPKKSENLRRWVMQDVMPMAKNSTRVWVPHTVFQQDDVNQKLEKSKTLYLLEVPCLDRIPTRLDFEEVLDDTGTIVDYKLTESGKKLKAAWPCPHGDETVCPAFDDDHYKAVGFHRPVKDLLRWYATEPIAFFLQGMHKIVASDLASVKPYMMRFYTKNPDDHRIGKVASWHKDWDRWVEERPEVGLNKQAPTIVLFDANGGVVEGKGEAPRTTVDACVQAWDLAIGKTTRSDRTVCCTTYRTVDKRYFNVFRAGRWRHDVVWKMIASLAATNPIMLPREVGVEVNGFSEIYKTEGERILREAGLLSSLKITEIRRTKDKDKVFAESGLPLSMMNGLQYYDIDDEDSIRELLSVLPDQSSAHDDIFDANVNSFPLIRHVSKMSPGFFGRPTDS